MPIKLRLLIPLRQARDRAATRLFISPCCSASAPSRVRQCTSSFPSWSSSVTVPGVRVIELPRIACNTGSSDSAVNCTTVALIGIRGERMMRATTRLDFTSSTASQPHSGINRGDKCRVNTSRRKKPMRWARNNVRQHDTTPSVINSGLYNPLHNSQITIHKKKVRARRITTSSYHEQCPGSCQHTPLVCKSSLDHPAGQQRQPGPVLHPPSLRRHSVVATAYTFIDCQRSGWAKGDAALPSPGPGTGTGKRGKFAAKSFIRPLRVTLAGALHCRITAEHRPGAGLPCQGKSRNSVPTDGTGVPWIRDCAALEAPACAWRCQVAGLGNRHGYPHANCVQ